MSTTWTTTKLKFKFKPYFFPFILLPAPPASTMASILLTHLLSVEHGEENAVPPTVHWWLFMERWQNRWATWLPPYPFLCINLSKGSKVTSACNWMTPSSPPPPPPHIDTLLHLITTPALLNGWFCISPYQLGLLPVWWNPHLLILLPLSYLSSRITTNNNPVHPPAGSAWFPAGFVFLPSPPPFPYLLPFCPPPSTSRTWNGARCCQVDLILGASLQHLWSSQKNPQSQLSWKLKRLIYGINWKSINQLKWIHLNPSGRIRIRLIRKPKYYPVFDSY